MMVTPIPVTAIISFGNAVVEGFFRNVWKMMEDAEKVATVFYDGSVLNADDFVKFCLNPCNLVVFGVSENRVDGMAWVNDVSPGTGMVHFCMFSGNPVTTGKALLEYYSSLPDTDGTPWFHALVGVTPASNEQALRFASLLGFRCAGTIPDYCSLYYEGRRDDGVITSYHPPREVPHGKE